mgnify:CR=1 FL=1
MIGNSVIKRSKVHETAFGLVLLVGLCASQSAFAANVDANATFAGTILDTCTVNVSTPGTLQASSDNTTLSSEETGGVTAVAAIVTNSTNSTVSVIAPVSFSSAPSGADTNTTFSTKYALTGATTSTQPDTG